MRTMTRTIFYYSIACVLAVLLLLTSGTLSNCSDTFPLDKETVFCLYFKLSGTLIPDQDIEELCTSSGKPMFTAYKASELYTKNKIRHIRQRLSMKTEKFDDNSLFTWIFHYTYDPDSVSRQGINLLPCYDELPNPTPFIAPEISSSGQRRINKQVALALDNAKYKKKSELQIIVYLKPKKITFRYQKRKVACQRVRVPLRRIIFYPVKIEIVPSSPYNKTLLSHNIS
jgi:hypothetical protein